MRRILRLLSVACSIGAVILGIQGEFLRAVYVLGFAVLINTVLIIDK